ncbi:hypothetical protein [Nocardioides sp. YIM 152315]|uniref:hypothetical protein n=1 Tax=Nocardioides sp. YIM 152315 TaxID=3031760 RepID=UPI0023DA94F1|nr:hypothetical protein [Nocardioides sp. YIM 152315]MDF1605762.1 hypothetical protein [Nocardioides sp. YIM 152315]
MGGKLSFLVGMGVGYVLGARAGRGRYDQIAEKAQAAWRDPRVQERVGQAQGLAKEKAGQAAHEVADRAGHAQQALRDKVASSEDGSTST